MKEEQKKFVINTILTVLRDFIICSMIFFLVFPTFSLLTGIKLKYRTIETLIGLENTTIGEKADTNILFFAWEYPILTPIVTLITLIIIEFLLLTIHFLRK